MARGLRVHHVARCYVVANDESGRAASLLWRFLWLTPVLMAIWENTTRGNARIWRYDDCRYLFDLVRKNGTCFSVSLPSFEDAKALWDRTDGSDQARAVMDSAEGCGRPARGSVRQIHPPLTVAGSPVVRRRRAR